EGGIVLLAIDVGNTEITLGLFDGATLARSFRLSSETHRTQDEVTLVFRQIFPELDGRKGHAAVIASVVPAATPVFLGAARALCAGEPVEITAASARDLTIEYRDPASMGADRIANAVGTLELYGAP